MSKPTTGQLITQILEWPLLLVKNPSLYCAAATIGIPYLAYGMPDFGGGLQPLLMWYGLAGVSYAGAEYLAGEPNLPSSFYVA